MKRWINKRIITLCTLGLCAGILTSVAFETENLIWAITVALLFIAFLVFTLVFRKHRLVSLSVLLAICITTGYLATNIQIDNINKTKIGSRDVYLIGVITDNYFYSEEESYVAFTLRDVSITYDDSIEISFNSQVSFRQYFPSIIFALLQPGDVVSFYCTLIDMQLFKDGVNTFMIRNSLYWEIDSINSDINFYKGKLKFNEQVRLYIKNTFNTYLQPRNSSVAAALVIGDKSNMVDDLKMQFRQSGISHIFAVSGLHVGFIVMAISFVFTKILKCNKWFSLIFITICSFLYQYICGFSPSIVRAIIMTIVLQLSDCIGENNDLITSTSIAAFIILLFGPLYLFDAGFQLSFAAIIGIATVSRTINIFLNRRKLSKFVKNLLRGVAVAVGATCGTFGLAVHYYGEFSLLGVFVNIIIIGSVSFVFIFLLLGLVPFLSFLYVGIDKALSFVDLLTLWVSKQPLSVITIKSFGFAIIFLFVLLILLGGLINLSRKQKAITASVFIAVFCISSYYVWQPAKMTDSIYFGYDNYAESAVITQKDGDIFALTNLSTKYDVRFIAECAVKFGKTEIAIVCSSYSKLKYLQADLLTSEYGIEITAVYKLFYSLNSSADLFFSQANIEVINCPNNFEVNENLRFVAISNGNKLIAQKIEFNNQNIILAQQISQAEFFLFSNIFSSADFVLAKNQEYYIREVYNSLIVTTRYFQQGFYSTKIIGNFTILIRNDTIKMLK